MWKATHLYHGQLKMSSKGKQVASGQQNENAPKGDKGESYETSGYKDSAHGDRYQIKMLMLILRRACSANLQFKLSAGREGDNTLSYIVLEYQSADGRTETFLIKFRHRNDENSNVKEKDWTSKTGGFSLHKLFESYQNLVSPTGKFRENSIKQLILFTNANISKIVKDRLQFIEGVSPEKILGILQFNRTDRISPKFYQLSKNSNILNRSKSKNRNDGSTKQDDNCKRVTEGFRNKFILATNQPNLHDLEKIIADEIGEDFHFVDSAFVVSKISQFIHEWVIDKAEDIITKEKGDAFFENLKNEIKRIGIVGVIFENQEKKMVYGEFFEEAETRNFKKTIESTVPTLHITSASPSMTIIKLVQTLQNKENFLALDIKTLISLSTNRPIVNTFQTRSHFTLVVECVCLNEEEIAEARKVVSELREISMNEQKGKKIIFLVSNKSNNYIALLHKDKPLESIEDKSNYSVLTHSAQGRILNYTVKFQGCNVQLKQIVNDSLTQLLNEDILNKIVEKDPICIGEPLSALNEIESYYITRKLEMKLNSNVGECDTKIRVIECEPGIGKSTELTRMALSEKKTDENVFVIKIALLDFSYELNRLEKIEKEAVLQFLATTGKMKTEFEKTLLRHLLYTNRVALFIDGFDDICPSYAEKVTQLLTFLNDETKVKKMWVTTRPQQINILEKELNPKFYYLQHFDELQQKDFLNKYWLHKIRATVNIKYISKFTDQLLTLLYHAEFKEISKLVGNPLQTRMIAEIYENKCKEFCSANGATEHGIEKINVGELFEEFLNKKLEIYFTEKVNMEPQNTYAKKTKERVSKQCRKQVQRMAFGLLFPKYSNVFFSKKNNDPVNWINCGLIQHSKENVTFIHHAFVEYFVADFLAEKWQYDTNDSYLSEVWGCICFEECYKSIRCFLDSILENDKYHQ